MNREFSADLIARQRLLIAREQQQDIEKFAMFGHNQQTGNKRRLLPAMTGGRVGSQASKDDYSRNQMAANVGNLGSADRKDLKQQVEGQGQTTMSGKLATGGQTDANWMKTMYGQGGVMQGQQQADKSQATMDTVLGNSPAGANPPAGANNPTVSNSPTSGVGGSNNVTALTPATNNAGAQTPPAGGAQQPPAGGAQQPPGGNNPSPPLAGGAQQPPGGNNPSPPLAGGAQQPPAGGAQQPAGGAQQPAQGGQAPAQGGQAPAAGGQGGNNQMQQMAQNYGAAQDMSTLQGGKQGKETWLKNADGSSKGFGQLAGSIAGGLATGGLSNLAGAGMRALKNRGVKQQNQQFDGAANRMNQRAMGGNPMMQYKASQESAERIYSSIEHIGIRKSISEKKPKNILDLTEDDVSEEEKHNRKVMDAIDNDKNPKKSD